jgi:hypothetical protein
MPMIVSGMADIMINAKAELEVCNLRKKMATNANAKPMPISVNTSKVICHSPSPENE